MARTLYGGTGGDTIVEKVADADAVGGFVYAPSTQVFEVFTTRTGSTKLTDLQTLVGGATATVTPDALGRVWVYCPDPYTGEVWLRDMAATSAARYQVFPADLITQMAALTAAVASATDHNSLDNLDVGDFHPQYLTPGRGDARYMPLNPVLDTQDPTVPNNFIADTITQTTANLTWDAATDNVGVTGYHVYRTLVNVGGGGGGTPVLVATTSVATRTFFDTGLSANTDYTYNVTAFDLAGNESDITLSILQVTTPAIVDVTPPTVPTGLAATVTGTTFVQLEWSASVDTESGVASYKLYQGLGSGTVDLTTPIATVTGLNYTVSGLTNATAYKWRVSAVDAAPAANESAPCAALPITTLTLGADTTAPFQVAGLAASAILSTSLTLSWTATTDNPLGPLANYNIYRALGAGSGSGGASPFLTHAHEGTVGTTPTGPAEGYASRTGTNVAYVATAAVGSQSLRFDGAALTYFDDTAIGAGTLAWSAPVRVESLGASSRFLAARASTTSLALVDIGTTGLVRILSGTSTFLATSTVALSINTWYRIDAKFTNGTATVRIFDAAGATLLDTVTTTATTAGVPDALRTGLRAVGDPTLIDQVKIATNWITVVPGAGTTTLIGSVPGSRVNYAATGLQPGTLYSFQVAAMDPSTNVGTKSTAVTPTTAAAATKQIIYGINATTVDGYAGSMRDRDAAHNFKMSPTDSTSWVDTTGAGTGVGMTRTYYGTGGLPRTFSSSFTCAGFGTNPKKRANITFKGYTPQQILNGAADIDYCSYVNDIPVDWEIAMTYWHEPANDLNTGDFTADKYRQAQIRFGALLENRTMGSIGQAAKAVGTPTVSLAAGTNVYTAVCITLRGLSGTAQGQVTGRWDTGVAETSVMNALPQATDLDAKACILLDAYQNPPPSINPEIPSHRSSPPPYTNAYTNPANVHGYFFAHVIGPYEYNVGQHGWGVGEFMAPLRDDDDASGTYQAEAVNAYLTYCENATPTPRIILFWEHPAGVQFNQTALPAARRAMVQHALGQYAI